MSSTKKWLTAIVVGVSVNYRFIEHMDYMNPIVTWLNKRIGSDTLIETLLAALLIFVVLSDGENEATVTEPAQPPLTQHHHHYMEPAEKEPSPPKTAPRRRIPNIAHQKGRVTRISEMGNTFYEANKDGNVKAVIAELRNEPGEFSLITWHHVRASIAYYNEQGDEVADVGRASWLDSSNSVLDFPSQVTRKLIVAIKPKDWIAVPPDTSVAFDGDDALVSLPENIRRARIILQDDREFSLPFTIDVNLSAGTADSLTRAVS